MRRFDYTNEGEVKERDSMKRGTVQDLITRDVNLRARGTADALRGYPDPAYMDEKVYCDAYESIRAPRDIKADYKKHFQAE